MKRQAERIPVADEYILALGRATYNFAYLEWGMIWLAEAIKPGFLPETSTMTAGMIAHHFSKLVSKLTNGDKDQLVTLADDFTDLVVDRNRLMHGNPYTAEGGEQRLSYNGKHGLKRWTVLDMMDFADKLASASIEANKLLHSGRYAEWQKTMGKP